MFEAVPTTALLLNGNARLVEDSTVKDPVGVLVNENWSRPLLKIDAPLRVAVRVIGNHKGKVAGWSFAPINGDDRPARLDFAGPGFGLPGLA